MVKTAELVPPRVEEGKSILKSSDEIINFSIASAGRFKIFVSNFKENISPQNPLEFAPQLADHLEYFRSVVTRAEAEKSQFRSFKMVGYEWNPNRLKAASFVEAVSLRAVAISLAIVNALAEKHVDQKPELKPLIQALNDAFANENKARGNLSTQVTLSATTNSIAEDGEVTRYSSNFDEAQAQTRQAGANIMRSLTAELSELNLLAPVEHWLLPSENQLN